MNPRIRRRRRLGATLLAVLAVPGAVLALNAPDDVRAQSAAGPVGIEAQIGPASSAKLLGGAPQGGAPNEAWGFTDADGTNSQPATVDGAELPPTRSGIVRYRPDEGWRTVQTPQDAQGQPFPGTLTDGRVTARGGLVISSSPVTGAGETVLLVRDAVGPTRALPQPGDAVLRPGAGSTPKEALSPTVIAGRALADGRTEAFAGIVGRPLQSGIARWDGSAWSRDEVCVATDAANTAPDGCSAADTLEDSRNGLTAVSLATSEGGSAWLLARAHEDTDRGLVLFERTGEGAAARWRLRDLGAPRFAAAATPADGITEVTGRPGGRALTATADGVWIDGSFRQNGTVRSVTLRRTAGGTRSWCDGGLCDAPLGFSFTGNSRSQAFADGTRVVGLGARYATFDGTDWAVQASFGAADGGIAFSSLTEGWNGDVHVTRERPASPLAAWSVPVRRPLTAIASGPGTPGDVGTPALAVGLDGNILRYTPGQGWDSEVKLDPGGVARDDLRGVAWPTADTAHAVGDQGAMWRWRRQTGLWESDPAKPYDFVGHLTGVAFQPGDPDRGFAVGRDGVLLRYGKSWEPMALPAEAATTGPGGGKADLYGVAFAGSQALAAAGSAGVLVEDGAGWKVDPGVDALMKRLGRGGRILAVGGLPDGGAVAAGSNGDGQGTVMERDSAGGPWRFSDQPINGAGIAVAAFRDGERVRALVSVTARPWPSIRDLELPATDPAQPAPRRAPFSVPAEGYLLRETAAGWRDEERTKLSSPTSERPRKSDPNLALLADPAGRAWAVGGWNGESDNSGRGTPDEATDEAQTAAVSRYDPAGPQGSSNVALAAPAMPAGRARLLVGGHAACVSACADLAPIDTLPDRTLSRAGQLANQLGAEARGPRAFVYTGGRVATGGAPAPASEYGRFVSLLAGNALPTFAAAAPADAVGGSSSAFETAFAGAGAPFGQSPAPVGTTPVAIGAPAAPGRARTHYAVDVATGDGPVRLVVIDNAAGSLEARNPAGNPVQDQASWLRAVLADAKSRGIAVVVSGSRSLDSSTAGAASDAGTVAALLRDGGASAYVYDGDGQQRRGAIPFGSGSTIPTFASGTLGYRPLADPEGRGVPGLLLLELDLAARDAATNRAPAAVRLIPVLDDLAIDAVDGRILNRSQPALFQGLGRRPRGGAVWTTEGAGSGDGADPYVRMPSPICGVQTRAACAATRIDPEVTFTSSDPDIANFVRVDPTSTNPRKPYVDPATDKPVADPTSGLVCPFNAGTTTISISSGGLTYKTTLTVRDGSVLRPCGTVPLNPSRFEQPSAAAGAPTAPPPPSSPPANNSPNVDVPVPASIVPPLLPAPAPPATPAAVTPPPTPRPTPTAARPLPAPGPAFIAPILSPPLAVPPPPAAASPAPPPGTSGASINVPVSQPVTQAERQKDEEVAEESSKAYARYDAVASQDGGHGTGTAAAVIGLVLLAAAGGGTAIGTRRRRQHPYDYARATTRDHDARVTARHRRTR